MNVETKRFEASEDACYQIVHTYHFINWCTWDPANTEIAVVQRPDSLLTRQVFLGYTDQYINTSFIQGLETRDGVITSPLGRDGINDIDDRTDGDPYRTDLNIGFDGDFVLIDNADTARNATTYRATDEFGITRNYVSAQEYGNFLYRQIIRVIDVTPPTIEVDPFDVFCGGDEEPRGNVCIAPVDMIITLDDLCEVVDKLTLSYQLKPFNGTAINDPFGTLEDLGDGRYRIRGNYPIQQGGTATTHTFVLKAQDACRNTTELEVPFQVVDCKAPTPKCIFGLSTTSMPNGTVTIAADWFDRGSFDFCSDVTLTFADPAIYPDSTIRTFRCENGELGIAPVQLWARDAAGNAAFCETFVNILAAESDEFADNPCVIPTQGASTCQERLLRKQMTE
ncbi:MAG: hypothetical protein HC912_08480 [Saprospiraceae bacterium]|nr:hypothetical protein [Saprospiraceae bacterium]